MSKIDLQLFSDIADVVGLKSPAFVEKDYHVIQLLKLIFEINQQDCDLCFAGGTCLGKAYINTYRMSEDIDIKYIPNYSDGVTKNQRKNIRKKFKEYVLNKIKENDTFNILRTESRDEGSYRCFFISYPKQYSHNSLRSELKLEFTEVEKFYFAPEKRKISSLCNQVLNKIPEISELSCDKIEVILAEKLISLLRRTAEASRGYCVNEDEQLIRHLYDIKLIHNYGYDAKLVKNIFNEIILKDKEQFGNRHPEFKELPDKELKYGLNQLILDSKYENRYKKFLNPLVYNKKPPTWQECLSVVENLIDLFCEN